VDHRRQINFENRQVHLFDAGAVNIEKDGADFKGDGETEQGELSKWSVFLLWNIRILANASGEAVAGQRGCPTDKSSYVYRSFTPVSHRVADLEYTKETRHDYTAIVRGCISFVWRLVARSTMPNNPGCSVAGTYRKLGPSRAKSCPACDAERRSAGEI
jgi:hypothetical protein